ncbi:probable basic-leucine zipper transcription factor Q [Coccinella septempunctata]|uniref:probable basic-leucine zipper transcription factor Q n=1 Tax=Coccinella septempunctata TaxID=41139 RepID=UPI001D08CA01|nr:probable basic-leucine zipper transcription factor Q [Coccinella septempunctata]
MNILPLSLAFFLCLVCFADAEAPTTKSPTPKKTRTADKETSYVPKEPVNSPTNFGFVPVKTSENYIQKEPLGRYIYPDLLRQTQAYTSKYSNYEKSQPTYQQQLTQYTQQQQQQASPSYHFAQTQATQYVYPEQYVQQPQDFSQTFDYQFSSPQFSQYYQEPATKNVNYVSANYIPQYLHLQQSSNSIENVISPKDQGVRYIMFIPSYVPQQSAVQNYYVSQQTAPQEYTTINQQSQHTAPQEYTTIHQQPQQTASQAYTTINQQPQQVQYVYNTEPSVNSQKESSYEKEPSSLLDSYVPSVVQLQYYKKLQAQSQANQIANNEKQTSHSSKKSNGKYER